jgi:hypothetical protein
MTFPEHPTSPQAWVRSSATLRDVQVQWRGRTVHLYTAFEQDYSHETSVLSWKVLKSQFNILMRCETPKIRRE